LICQTNITSESFTRRISQRLVLIVKISGIINVIEADCHTAILRLALILTVALKRLNHSNCLHEPYFLLVVYEYKLADGYENLHPFTLITMSSAKDGLPTISDQITYINANLNSALMTLYLLGAQKQYVLDVNFTSSPQGYIQASTSSRFSFIVSYSLIIMLFFYLFSLVHSFASENLLIGQWSHNIRYPDSAIRLCQRTSVYRMEWNKIRILHQRRLEALHIRLNRYGHLTAASA